MVISFYGEGCFKIQSGDMVLLVDPINPSSGLTQPRFKFDISLKTLSSLESEAAGKKENEGFQIIGPGEYNIKDIDISGIGLINESSDKFIKNIFIVMIEGIKMCFLGHISEMPEADILEKLEEIDILFIPAGGKPFIYQKLEERGFVSTIKGAKKMVEKERPEKGEVLAVGPGKMLENGTRQQMSVKVGDIVLFKKYGPDEFKLDGVEYLLLEESDIIGIIAK